MKAKTKEVMTTELLESSREFDTKELFREYFQHSAHRTIVWSWGAQNWRIHKDFALCFTVNGRIHKGAVFVTLAWNDTFTIYLVSSKRNIKSVIEGVYIDQLIDIIDGAVETI